jgi:hypothetical protein
VYEQKKQNIDLRNIKAQLEAHEAMLGLVLNFLIAESPSRTALQATLRGVAAYKGPVSAKQALAKLANGALSGA